MFKPAQWLNDEILLIVAKDVTASEKGVVYFYNITNGLNGKIIDTDNHYEVTRIYYSGNEYLNLQIRIYFNNEKSWVEYIEKIPITQVFELIAKGEALTLDVLELN
jgi:hypothetical protein